MLCKTCKQERPIAQAPYGFMYTEEGYLIKNPAEQALMAVIRQARVDGLTYNQVL